MVAPYRQEVAIFKMRKEGSPLSRSWALALVMLCLATGCLQAPPSNDTQAVAAQVQDYFDRRARQLAAHDSQAFLESVDPAAGEAEELLVRGFGEVPAESPAYEIQAGSLSKTGPATYRVNTRLNYRYRDFPENNSFSFPLTYTLALDPSVRILKSEADKPPIWATGPVERYSSQHFLSLSRPGLPGVGELAGVAEAAYGYLQERVPAKLEERLLMVLAADAAEFELFSGGADPSNIGRAAQVKGSVEVEPGTVTISGRHMIVNLQQLALDRNGPETLRHELAHLALALETRPTTPGWLAEGAALYLAGSRPRQAVAAGMRLTELSRTSQLGAHEASDSAAEYAYAAAAVWYLVETHGEQRFWDLYSFFAGRPATELYDAFRSGEEGLVPLRVELTQEAVGAIYGLTLDGLDRAVGDWIAKDLSAGSRMPAG